MLSKSNSLLCADYLELESLYRKSFFISCLFTVIHMQTLTYLSNSTRVYCDCRFSCCAIQSSATESRAWSLKCKVSSGYHNCTSYIYVQRETDIQQLLEASYFNSLTIANVKFMLILDTTVWQALTM